MKNSVFPGTHSGNRTPSRYLFPGLLPFGWGEPFATHAQTQPDHEPARLVAVSRGLALAQGDLGEVWCTPTGRFRSRMETEGLALCAGDWVMLRRTPGESRALLVDLLPRITLLARQEAGSRGRGQVLASNLDCVLLAMGLDRDFNPARMERLLALAMGSGAQPVIVLTKADLVEDPAAFVARMEGLASGVPVIVLSTITGMGLREVRSLLGPGRTGVLIGSSGVGKSTLLNALAGSELRLTREVRASDGRGRHTTSLRELFLLPDGGCLIDTPGIREVGLLAGAADLQGAFADIEALAEGCRYRDCAHGAEPGCAVHAAMIEGFLEPQRYEHFLRLRREVEYTAARADERLWRERERRWRDIAKASRSMKGRK